MWKNHPHLREVLGYYALEVGEDHGVFWMPLKDFFHYFGRLEVCRVRDASFASSLRSHRTVARDWADTRLQLTMRDSGNLRGKEAPAVTITVTMFLCFVFCYFFLFCFVLFCLFYHI